MKDWKSPNKDVWYWNYSPDLTAFQINPVKRNMIGNVMFLDAKTTDVSHRGWRDKFKWPYHRYSKISHEPYPRGQRWLSNRRPLVPSLPTGLILIGPWGQTRTNDREEQFIRYVGETSRNLNVRLIEHGRARRNGDINNNTQCWTQSHTIGTLLNLWPMIPINTNGSLRKVSFTSLKQTSLNRLYW